MYFITDYYECLHRQKEKNMVWRILQEKKRILMEEAREEQRHKKSGHH